MTFNARNPSHKPRLGFDPPNGIALRLWVIIATCLVSGAARAMSSDSTTKPTSMDDPVANLIGRLSSDDPAVRDSASKALLGKGPSIRPAILKAVKSDDPEIRQEAIQILLSLPWARPQDPTRVQAELEKYGVPEIESRREVILELSQLPGDIGLPAMARLLQEEPSPAVRWTIVTCFREHDRGPQLVGFRALIPPRDDPQMLALCGYAQLSADPATATKYLNRCAILEFANPTDDDGEFDFVIRMLADEACARGEYAQAADLRRKEFARGSPQDAAGVSTALLELFALQAQFGPIKGLDDDIKLAGSDLHRPKIQYALSLMYDRAHDTAKATAARQAAFAASSSRKDRFDVGEYLFDHGWDDLARAEYEAFLKMSPGDNPDDVQTSDANVHFRLAGLAIKRGDDFTAAHEKEQAIQLLDGRPQLYMVDAEGHRWEVSVNDIWAEIQWRYMRAAAAKHDENETNRRLDALLTLKPTDADIAIDVVPLLRKRGRSKDADALFQWAFDSMRAKLDADPHNPESLNGIAWLCVECDQRLDDAVRWATEAVAAAPDNAAILDTLAEVHFHLGQPAEALRLETRATQLDPSDDFMKGQVRKFRAATATRPDAPGSG